MSHRVLAVALASCCLTGITAPDATAQDLFELEVFEYDSTRPGGYEIELHANAMSRGSVAADSALSNHRPTHISVEVTRGWTDRIETAVFLQTAPFGSMGSARFAGGHLRGKVRIGTLPIVPLLLAVSAEYAFNRQAFNHELQTFETRAVVGFERGRLSLTANPSLEIVTHGSEEGLEPVFDLSARAAWRLASRVTLTTDYFSAAATTRHLRPEPRAHHLMFSGVDLGVGSSWELGISAGHCLTSQEPWLMKSIVGYRF
jgi:hypothetical protein